MIGNDDASAETATPVKRCLAPVAGVWPWAELVVKNDSVLKHLGRSISPHLGFGTNQWVGGGDSNEPVTGHAFIVQGVSV